MYNANRPSIPGMLHLSWYERTSMTAGLPNQAVRLNRADVVPCYFVPIELAQND